MSSRHPQSYGTARDHADSRDVLYEIPSRFRHRLPPAVDLRGKMPPIYSQKHLNACSAHAIAAALWFDARRRLPREPSPSRLFIYYNERSQEGVVSTDATVSLRDGYKTVAQNGVCSERLWPYDIRRYRRRPPPSCFDAAERHRAIRYARVQQTLRHMHACLAEGYPFAVGVGVYQTFKSELVKRTGVIPLPDHGRDRFLGGHAMLMVGYLEDSRHFIVRNSYGREWGDGGYGYLPYRYALDPHLAWDLWSVRRIT